MNPAPDWLEKAWQGSKDRGLDLLTPDDTQSEIEAYRREKQQAPSQETR